MSKSHLVAIIKVPIARNWESQNSSILNWVPGDCGAALVC